MRHDTPRMLAAAFLALAAASCNKGPAEDAIRVAEQDIATARPQLETYAPGELEALESTVGEARAQLAQGRYTEALKAVHRMPARVRAALAVAASRKEGQAAGWNALAESVPRLQETIATRIAWLEEAQRLPRGMDEAAFGAVPGELEAVKRAWAEASAAFAAGDVAGAVRSGEEVRKKAEILATRLGLVLSASSPPTPPTASPTPRASPTPIPLPAPGPSPTPSASPTPGPSPTPTPTPPPPPPEARAP